MRPKIFKMSEKNWILFYEKGQFFEFSNFYKAPIVIDGLEYNTVEHYFQSRKFSDNKEYSEIIRNVNTPGKAKVLGSQKTSFNYKWAQELKAIIKKYEAKLDPNWDSIKDEVMLRALRAKFTQNSHCRELLLSTGDSYIVENSGSRDGYWGNGLKDLKDPNKIGRLGLLLMQVREELKKKE